MSDNESIVVRVRALRYLRLVSPADLYDDLAKLLEIPNDPWLYEVIDLLRENPDHTLSP